MLEEGDDNIDDHEIDYNDIEYENESSDSGEEDINHNVETISNSQLCDITSSEDIVSTHTTSRYISKYEKTKFIGIRAQQIAHGANIYIKVPKNVTDVESIAELEYEQKKTPLIIKRNLPNNISEYWKLKDLII